MFIIEQTLVKIIEDNKLGGNMNIRPLGKRILVKKVKEEEVRKSGIVLPGKTGEDQPTTGEVVAIGKEIEDIKVGDKIIHEKYTGTEVKDGDETYLILNLDNVLAITD